MGVLIYSKDECKYCTQSKSLLINKNIPYKEIKLNPNSGDEYISMRNKLISDTGGHRTFPWVFVGNEFVGGFSELRHSFCTGSITPKLKNVGINYKEDDDF